jgi:hypothetical protein
VVVIIDPDFMFLKPLPPFWLETLAEDEVYGGYYDIGNWHRAVAKKGIVRQAVHLVRIEFFLNLPL